MKQPDGKWEQFLSFWKRLIDGGAHLGPLSRDPDHLAGVVVAALHVRGTDQVCAVHLVDLLTIVVLTLQSPPPVTPSACLTAL